MRKKENSSLVYPAIDEIDDVYAKQYHQASFSTRNSALNTSLRKPIRMQDFIQLCDSKSYCGFVVDEFSKVVYTIKLQRSLSDCW